MSMNFNLFDYVKILLYLNSLQLLTCTNDSFIHEVSQIQASEIVSSIPVYLNEIYRPIITI